MVVQINDRSVTLPTSLSEFKLGQRIAFYNQYGKELDEMMQSITDMPEGIDRDMELAQFQMEKLFRTFAFFADTTPDALKESEFVDDIARIYYASVAILFEDEQQLELKHSFVWNKEEWELHPPTLANGSKIKFGEFIDSKQILKDMDQLGKGKWESMISLCAIYLRRKGEAYQEEWLYEGSERLKLMEDLPMDIAMQVGFFLSSSINTYLNTLQFSNQAGQKAEGDLALNTLPGGVG